MSEKTPYELLGGEPAVRELCKAFYGYMDRSEDAHELRDMHKEDLSAIEQKLFEYLSGWLGGPSLYYERTGTVCLSDAHKPYPIGAKERDQWLLCMDHALGEIGASDDVRAMLKEPFFHIADFVTNKA